MRQSNRKRSILGFGLTFALALSQGVAARAASLEERLDELEKKQDDLFRQSTNQNGGIKSFLGENLSLGGFFDGGFLAIGGPDTISQVSAGPNILGINLAAEFNEKFRFNSQVITALSFNFTNPNLPTRLFSGVAASTVMLQSYVEYMADSLLVVQMGMGYVPFGIAHQQRELVLFRRRGGPQLINISSTDGVAAINALWEGIHIGGSSQFPLGRWGYDAYTFTPVSNARTVGGGLRTWLSLGDTLALGVSGQAGKRLGGITFLAGGADAKFRLGRFAATFEYAKGVSVRTRGNPWSAYLEPEVSFFDGKFLVYGVVDYLDDPLALTSPPAALDSFKELAYGGGVNFLPTPFTRFRVGYLWRDYIGNTAVVRGLSRDLYTLDVSAGVAF